MFGAERATEAAFLQKTIFEGEASISLHLTDRTGLPVTTSPVHFPEVAATGVQPKPVRNTEEFLVDFPLSCTLGQMYENKINVNVNVNVNVKPTKPKTMTHPNHAWYALLTVTGSTRCTAPATICRASTIVPGSMRPSCSSGRSLTCHSHRMPSCNRTKQIGVSMR